MFGFLENFFFISLGITFGLILLLIYHFKERISAVERKGETVYELLTNIVKEINVLKNGHQSHEHFIRSAMFSGALLQPNPEPVEDNISVYYVDTPAPAINDTVIEVNISTNSAEIHAVVSDSDDDDDDSASGDEYDSESNDDNITVSEIGDDNDYDESVQPAVSAETQFYEVHVVSENNNPPQAPDYLRNTTSQDDFVNHLNLPVSLDVSDVNLSEINEHPKLSAESDVVYEQVQNDIKQAIEQAVEQAVDKVEQMVEQTNVQFDDDNISTISSVATAAKQSYNKLNLTQLRALASSVSSTDVSRMKKQELVQFMKSLDDESAK